MKKYSFSIIPFFIFLLVFVFIFRNWLTPTLLSGGDWVYYYPSMVKSSTLFASWDDRYSGMGNNKVIKLPMESYFVETMKLTQGLDWRMYERLFWFFPFMLLAISSSFLLTKKILKNRLFALLGSFLYVSNTYSLMLIGGGQNGVAMAYASLPLLILTFLNLLENSDTIFFSLLFTFSLSIVALFDLRVVYVGLPILVIIALFYFLHFFPKDKLLKRFLYIVVIPGLATFFLHAFWLLPLLLSRGSAISQFGEAYTGVESVKFFSFAFLENSIGLLQPNWPDNIFGKVGFMRWEFLSYPILAFGSLLFVEPFPLIHSLREKRKYIYILCFGFASLVGVFLGKGANEPFGNIYLWLFGHVPGFVLFRDPTKWYMIISLSYSILISFSVEHIYCWLQSRTKFQIARFKFSNVHQFINFQNIFILFSVGSILFTIKPALLGQLGGTFKPHIIPSEYKKLEAFFTSQKSFSRSLWIPNFQRFSSFTEIHPAIPSEDYYHVSSISGVLDKMKKDTSVENLRDASVKYVIVPFDSEEELFLKDRKYDEITFKQTVASVSSLPYLSEIPGFGKIHVFEINNSKDHFWTDSRLTLSYIYINPTEYQVTIKNALKGDRIIFAESFDSGWRAEVDTNVIVSQPFKRTLNSFVLPKNGTYTLRVYYQPQEWVSKGLLVSCMAFFVVITGLLYSGYSWFRKHNMVE